jgi:pantothenate kinase
VTGGGAWKYANLIKEKVGLPIDKRDEMKCIVGGCNFLLKNISDETFVYHRREPAEYKFQGRDSSHFTMISLNVFLVFYNLVRILRKNWLIAD